MSISINNLAQVANQQASGLNKEVSSSEAHANFGETMKNAIDSLSKVQQESDGNTEALATGEIDNLHEVMISAQKASIALEATVQVQSKVINAYNEVMRMQV